MGKIIKKLSMFFVMVVLAISFCIPLMMFPDKIYANGNPFTYTVSGGNATITGYDVAVGGTAVVIPSTLEGYPVTSIGDSAFIVKKTITSVTFTTPSNVTSIGDSAFNECTVLTIISIPSTVTSIGNYAFEDCYDLTSISIPSGVTSIGNGAFSHCVDLTSISIPSGVTSIGRGSFHHCVSLTSISIPSKVTSIDDSAFNECTALAKVTFEGATAPTTFGVGNNSFNYIAPGAKAYVPAGSIDAVGGYDSTKYPFLGDSPLKLTESEGSGGSRPLTPDEWVDLDLNMEQLLNHYGATPLSFLNILYDNSLQRISDESGLNYWNEQLTNNVFGANQIVVHFIFSDEIGAKVAAMTNDEFINFLYSTLFARVPDIDGYNNWLSYINSGFSKEETLRAFLNNEEWINICKMFGVNP